MFEIAAVNNNNAVTTPLGSLEDDIPMDSY
jgi:hypothetical protein